MDGIAINMTLSKLVAEYANQPALLAHIIGSMKRFLEGDYEGDVFREDGYMAVAYEDIRTESLVVVGTRDESPMLEVDVFTKKKTHPRVAEFNMGLN